jgi:dinuclear metal center YbgI/SA1388 family protein
VTYLDEYLAVAEWEEKSLNGLQVEGVAEVERIALATDAALATFAMASEAGAGFLIVHHGLFWGQVQPFVGPRRSRIAALLEAGISLYAAHLPLDAHAGVGNNAVLARLLKLENLVPFGRWGTRAIGWRGSLAAPTDRATLAAGLEALLGPRPDVLPFGNDEIRSLAIVSGAAADLVSEAAESGVDAFVTGETSHVAWHHARELGVNVFFAGHYATETLGVRALGDHLAGEFGVETVFLDSPTGY